MREILFRGKAACGAWIQGDLINRKIWNSQFQVIRIEDGGFDIYTEYEIITDTLGQFTGLTDKNGVKIFEGDIIKYDNRENVEVIYQPSEFALVFKSQEYPQCGLLTKYGVDKLEVIGNIYDNPELLKGGEE